MTPLAAFAKFYDNEDRSDVTIVITTEKPGQCRARKRSAELPEQAAVEDPVRDDDPPATDQGQAGASSAGAPSQAAQVAEPDPMSEDEDFTAVELHGHAVVLSAHSQFFDIATSRNSGFNTRPGFGEAAGREDRQYVVVSVGSEYKVETAMLMVKSMYGIPLPAEIAVRRVLSLVKLAHYYCVEPALCDALRHLNHLTAASYPQWLRERDPKELWAIYGTSTKPGVYDCVLAEAKAGLRPGAQQPAGSARLLPVLAAEVLETLHGAMHHWAERVAAELPQVSLAWLLVEALQRLPATEVAHLLSSTQLRVVCEDTVFALALRWLQANQGASTDDRRTVWNAIRLPGLSKWLKSMVLAGLPEATELMDPVSRQHMAACFVAGVAGPPPNLGSDGCSYPSDTLAWTPRPCGHHKMWRPQRVAVTPQHLKVLLQSKDAVTTVTALVPAWTYGGAQLLLKLQAAPQQAGQVDVSVAVGVHYAWEAMRPASLQPACSPLAVSLGVFGVTLGSGGPALALRPPRPQAPWCMMAGHALGTFPGSVEGVAQLQRLLTGADGVPHLLVHRLREDGTVLTAGVPVSGPGQPAYAGPSVRVVQSGA